MAIINYRIRRLILFYKEIIQVINILSFDIYAKLNYWIILQIQQKGFKTYSAKKNTFE
jgi:hypothetical protein